MAQSREQNSRVVRQRVRITTGLVRRPLRTPCGALMDILVDMALGRGVDPAELPVIERRPPQLLPLGEQPRALFRPTLREVRTLPRIQRRVIRRVPLLIPLRTEAAPMQHQPPRPANNPPQRLPPRRPVPVPRRPQRRPPLLVPLIRRQRPVHHLPQLAAVRPLNWPELQAQLQLPNRFHPPPLAFLLGPGVIPPLWPELLHNLRPPAWPPPAAPWTALALLFTMIYELPYDVSEWYRAMFDNGPPPAPNW